MCPIAERTAAEPSFGGNWCQDGGGTIWTLPRPRSGLDGCDVWWGQDVDSACVVWCRLLLSMLLPVVMLLGLDPDGDHGESPC